MRPLATIGLLMTPLAGLALTLALTLAPATASAQTIKLGTLAPEGSIWHTVLRDMGDAWAEASNGRIRVRIYAGGVAGDDADMVRKMRIGQLHAAALTGQGLASIASEMAVFQTPMLLRSSEELDFVRGRLNDKLEAILEEKGFKLLYWSEIGWAYLFSTSPVTGPDDLRPLKMWVWSGDTAWANALKDAGYRPVPLPATEIHTGLQSGLIDTFTMPPVAALAMQYFGVAKNMSRLKWAPLTAAVVVSMKTWNRIPDDLKPALLEAAETARVNAEGKVRAMEDEAIVAMEGYGLKVHDISPENTERWRAELRNAYPAMAGHSFPKGIFAEVEALLAEFRGAHQPDNNDR